MIPSTAFHHMFESKLSYTSGEARVSVLIPKIKELGVLVEPWPNKRVIFGCLHIIQYMEACRRSGYSYFCRC